MKKIVLAIILFTLIVNESFILLFVTNTMALPVDEASDGFIQSIRIEGSPAYAGTSITVILMGAPGGKATFTVSGNDTEIKMPEVKDGIYQGMYTVRWEDAIETHYVKARLTIGGNNAEVEEIFQVIRPPIMTSVSVIGSPAKVGDEIIIRVTGKTGAKARADIDKVAYDLPLTEMSGSALERGDGIAGVYEGRHTVAAGENVSAAVVTVYFTDEGETIVDKSRRVTIDTIAPEIFERKVDKSPLQNGSNFTLTVGCERGALVTVDLSQLDTTRGIAFLPEVFDGIFSKVFTISYDNIAINGMKTVEINARDAAGNQSTSELLVELRNTKLNTQQLEVSGQVIAKDGILSDDTRVLIYNAMSKREKISPLAADASFTVTFADDKHPVAEIGTTIYLSVITGSDVIASATHQLSSDEILASKTTMDVTITAEPKIDISIEPSTLPADGYSLAMVTVTAVDAGDAEVEVSASFGFIAPLTEAGPGVWTTTYTAGKTPGAVRLTASTLTTSTTAELLLTPLDAVAESIIIHSPLKRVMVGKAVYIRGMIDPPRFAEPVNLEVLEPDGISFVEYTTTGRDGQFSFQIRLNNQGIWRFRANHGRTTSSITEIYAEAEPYLSNRGREWKPSQIVENTDEINHLLEDSRGNLWAATNYGVMKFEDESWISHGLADKYVSSLFEDSRGTLWAATAGGVHKLLEDGGWREYSDGISAKVVVNALFEDSYGALWAATSNGVLRFDGDGWISSGLNGRYVSFLLEDDDGALLAATNDGVSWLDGEIWRRYSLLESIVVRSLLKDSRGVLWAATNSGVWRLTDEARKYTRNDGLVSNIVIYLLEDSHGILWAATNSGVCWFDGDRWRPYIYGLGSVVVRYLLEDTHGALWAATNNGVWRLMDETWKKYTTRDGLANDFVNNLLAQSDGTLWAATIEGVSKLEGETWRVDSDGLEGKSVNYLLEDGYGMLWAATDEGVSRLENGTWMRYGDGLEGKSVNYLLEDGYGMLWAATDEGVSRLENGTWMRYGDGLEGKSVNYLLEDGYGML
ncbi:MAG: two-component regulator propeller domain-containing protein, partial [Candidatus Poribacteria bacterium]